MSAAIRLLRPVLAVLLAFCLCGVARAIDAQTPETDDPAADASAATDAQAQEAPVTAAAAAACLRQEPGIADVTGNGVIDEADAEALLLCAVGSIPDLAALPAILEDSLLGEKHLAAFSYVGVQRGEGYFRSETISYTLETVEQEDLTYYVADILLRDLGHFRTAFGKDRYRGSEVMEDIAARHNAIVAINGDYYAWKDNGGPVIRNGVLYRDTIDKRRDACVLYADGTMQTYGPDETDMEAIVARGAYQCWTFGPSLLDENGQPKTESSQFRSTVQRANPRSVIGYIEPGHYLFVTVDGRGVGGSDGITMIDLSQLMYDLGCTVAFNLDGGGSAVMADASGAISNQSSGRKCCDILYIVEDYSVYSEETEE